MMEHKHLLLAVLREDDGQDLIEYALLAGLIALASIASIKVLATKIGNAFSNVGSQLTSAT
ncbi:pilus assembly protein Flp/PilA [Bryocella elongata]|uniref:Pilus assembly protein Flp/PilA n=1 Tax=Bryocella elongata TaxID=863522 RepID=A0A1H6B2J1_9BACT|nr:Flp family type IVb pilin [Bryocella elongata]SEG54565.1 pilus assembly protein Flp/PilA [Bryocella elongata]